MTNLIRRTFALAALLTLLIGCAEKKVPEHTVAGTVNIGAKPMEFGIIRFAADGGDARPQAANVKEGRYTAANLRPGKYTVTIEAMPPPATGPVTSDTKAAKPVSQDGILEKYRKGVPVEVTGDNPALDFDVSK